MKTIRLYNPPVFYFSGIRYRLNPTLGLACLATPLRRAGHDVAVIDLEALGITPARFAQRFAERAAEVGAPDVVGFTVTSLNRQGAADCIKELREVGYSGYIMVGGPYVTTAPEEARETLGADCCVVGEGDRDILRYVSAKPKGIVLGRATPADRIPSPCWEVHRPSPITYGGNLPRLAMPEGIAMWSRGCPHHCIFCSNPVFGRQAIRRRPVRAIYDDMATLARMGARGVFVYDDELVGTGLEGDKWLEEACEAIAPLGLVWKCQGRCAASMSLKTLQAMYRGGCRAIMWGVESLSQPVLDAMKKGTTVESIERCLALSHQAGIGNWLFLMVGSYKETADDLAVTYKRLGDLCKKGLVQWRQVTVCTPTRGSKLWEMAKGEGWLVEPPTSGPQMAQSYASTPWLDRREIALWQRRLEVVGTEG